jgi:hypothetical protein
MGNHQITSNLSYLEYILMSAHDKKLAFWANIWVFTIFII